MWIKIPWLGGIGRQIIVTTKEKVSPEAENPDEDPSFSPPRKSKHLKRTFLKASVLFFTTIFASAVVTSSQALTLPRSISPAHSCWIAQLPAAAGVTEAPTQRVAVCGVSHVILNSRTTKIPSEKKNDRASLSLMKCFHTFSSKSCHGMRVLPLKTFNKKPRFLNNLISVTERLPQKMKTNETRTWKSMIVVLASKKTLSSLIRN